MLPSKRKNLNSESPPGSPMRGVKRSKSDRTYSPQVAEPPAAPAGKAKDVDDALGGADEDADEDDAAGMEDEDYVAQQTWQSQSKDNVNFLLGKFSNEQAQRYAAYRRSIIQKNTVRKFIHHELGTNPSLNVAQIVAGFSKVFVGEMVEKARKVQTSKGETGPLAPDHLRQAYRMYQQETGRIGAARPQRGKKLFVR